MADVLFSDIMFLLAQFILVHSIKIRQGCHFVFKFRLSVFCLIQRFASKFNNGTLFILVQLLGSLKW